MEGRRFRLFALLAGLVCAGVLQVSSMKVTVQEEVEAVNGTDVKLQCSFLSSSPISPSAVSVSWNFRPMQGGGEESVFYFQDKPYPPERGRFLGQVVWAGDIARGDASIMVHDVKFTFNGTFSCQVKNPPDVHGTAGELQLRVVQTASFSEIAILATAIGGAIGLVLIILAIFISVKFCRQRSLERELEMSSWDGKDTTVCDPEETLPLNRREEENDSADDVISEASGRDLSSSEDEKRSLKVTAEITTDTETDTLPLKTETDPNPKYSETDTLPLKTDTDPNPKHTDTLPLKTETDPNPKYSETDTLPLKTETDPNPKHTDTLPLKTDTDPNPKHTDTLPLKTETDPNPKYSETDTLPLKTETDPNPKHTDTLPLKTDTDPNPKHTDTLPLKTETDPNPKYSETDTLPLKTEIDPNPKHTDTLPLKTETDPNPKHSEIDTLPLKTETDPNPNHTDTLPLKTETDSISKTMEISVTTDTDITTETTEN